MKPINRLSSKVMLVSMFAVLVVIALASQSIRELWVLKADTNFLLRDSGQAALHADFDLLVVRAAADATSFAIGGNERYLRQAQETSAKARKVLNALRDTMGEVPPTAGLESEHMTLIEHQWEVLAEVDAGIAAAARLGRPHTAEAVAQTLRQVQAYETRAARVRSEAVAHREAEYRANETAIRKAAQNAINTLGANVLLLFVLIGTIVLFTARYIVKPINELAVMTRAVAKGDLVQAVAHTSKDEIGYLQAAFHQMVRDLRVQQSALLERNAELARTIEDMTRAEERLQHALQAREEIAQQLRASRERLREFAASMNTQVESERRRIAHALHDELGQDLTALRMWLSRLARITSGDTQAQGILERSQQMVSDAAVSMRRIVADLRPLALDNFGLIAAAQGLVDDFAASANIEAKLEGEKLPEGLTDAQTTAIYRALQEALNNVAKHAQASAVAVRIAPERDGVALTVRDDGRGFKHEGSGAPGSYGLFGMAERAAQYGGSVSVKSEPGFGAEIKFWLPVADAGFGGDRLSGAAGV